MESLFTFNFTLKKQFPPNWGNDYSFNNDGLHGSELEEQIELFKKDISRVREELFELLNKSVLAGEYVEKEFEQKISEIDGLLEEIIFISFSDDIQSLLASEISENFIRCFKFAFKKYVNLSIRVRNRYCFVGRPFVHENDTEINELYNRHSFSESNVKRINFFLANVFVAEQDHFLTHSAEQFRALYKVVADKNISGDKYYSILLDKCHYLINKWSLRQEKIKQEAVYFIDNNKEQKISSAHFNSKLFDYWEGYIKSHYQFNNWKSEISSDFDLNRVKYTQLEKLTVLELHRAIKYYKDVIKNLANLTSIRKELLRRYRLKENPQKDIDFYSCSLALIYAYNNEFSLLISDPKSSEKAIDELYHEIHTLETSTGIKNFFIQFKYVEYLSKKLEELYSQRKALDFLVSAREIIDKCENVFTDYSKNVDWSELNYNYVFQLPYKECLVPYDSSNIDKVFLASSFVLPLSKEKNKKEFESHRSKVLVLKSTIEVLENIEVDIREFDKMKDDVRANQAKALEIIGVFTALVTFVFSSVEAFRFLDTTKDVLLFMLALSTSLGLFVVLLLFITKGDVMLKKHWIVISLFILMTGIFWALFFVKCELSDSGLGIL